MLKKLLRKNLAREITLILFIKIILISLIWLFFIKDYSVKFNDQEIANHLIAKPNPVSARQHNMESTHDL